jgi:hypothetical protein
MRIFITLLLASFVAASCSFEKLYRQKHDFKNRSFEQIDFDDFAKLYMSKSTESDPQNIEGIYSVSAMIMKKGKPFLSFTEKEKTLVRKENYSKVAIIRDRENSDREYFEVPLDKERLPSYSIRGEFHKTSEGNILVYRHFEPKDKVSNYSFTYDIERDILEGIRTETNGSATITFKLTYLKLYPKRKALAASAK